MHIANLITLFRIAAFPVIVLLMSQGTDTSYLWAIFLFILALGSDFLDGYLARKKNKVTQIGSFLDLLADKLLIFGLLLVFVLNGNFSPYIFAFFIARNVIVAILHWLASHEEVKVYRKWPSALTNYSQVAIIFGFLVNAFLIHQGSVYDSLIIASGLFIYLSTVCSVFFSTISMLYYAYSYWKGVHYKQKLGKEIKTEHLVVLANKKARGYFDKYRRHLLKIFAKRRSAPLYFLPEHKTEMFLGIEKTIEKYPHIIIAGGDGSFESALNYKPLHKKSLGFFPFGGGNSYYSYFYKGKRFEYLRSRFNFREMDLDILELTWENGKIQTTFLSAGIDAEVPRFAGNERTVHSLFDYLKACWKALFRAKSGYDFKVITDGKQQYLLNNCVNLTLAKIPYYGFALRSLLGGAHPDDGEVYGLAVINTHSMFTNKLARIWALVLTGLNLEKNPLLKLRNKQIMVQSEVPFPIQAGGDYLGYTRWLKVRVKRKQKVLVI